MINTYNTQGPGTTGKSGGLGTIFTLAIVGLALYFGYKYLIKPQTPPPSKQG